MNDTQLEMRLTELLDGICAADLAKADDVLEHTACSLSLDDKAKARICSNALRKAGIAMKEKSSNKLIKRIKVSAMAVLAAAVIMTVSAAAVGIAANHEHTVESIFGTGASAELAAKGILVNKATVNDHFAFTIDTAYATEDYARLIMTLEGVDDKGRGFIKNTKDFMVDMLPLEEKEDISEHGYGERYELDEQEGCLTIDMDIDLDMADGRAVKLIISPQNENNGVPLLIEYLSSIKRLASVDITLRPNISPIRFTAEGKPDISLCDYEILTHISKDLIRDPKQEYESGLIGKDEYEKLKSEPVITFVFNDGSKRSLTCGELIYSSHLLFKGTRIDSQNVSKVILEKSKTEYTRR